MSDMKCPFCLQKMSKTENNMFYCGTDNCDLRYIEMPKKAVEDFAKSHQDRLNDCKKICNLNEELIRTKKQLVTKCNQLEIAVDALKRIDETRSGVKENLHATNGRTLNAGNGFCWTTIDDIHNALEQITALEQKDVK